MKVTKRGGPHHSDACLKVHQVLSRIGDKWSLLVVDRLGEGPHRFSDLQRSIDDISQRMLTLTLRTLERDGLVRRTVTPSLPPRVDYELTELGHSLQEPVSILSAWVEDNIGAMETARQTYDAEHRAAEAQTARAFAGRA